MNKKILSIFLAVAMLVSSMSTALAAKKNYEDEADEAGSNIYELWGGFEDEAVLNVVSKMSSSSQLSIVRGGAAGTKSALKIDNTNAGTSGDIIIPFPVVAGETYDISFYVKTDTVGSTSLGLIKSLSNRWLYLPTATMQAGTWTKYTATWSFAGVNDHGDTASDKGNVQFRFGGTSSAIAGVYYIDELEIVPRGFVPADYSSVNTAYLPSE